MSEIHAESILAPGLRSLVWLTDAALYVFAAWSLLCHATVVAGGSLRQLAWAMVIVAPALAWAARPGRTRPGRTRPGRTRPPARGAEPAPSRPVSHAGAWLPLLLLAAAGPLVVRLRPSWSLATAAGLLALLAAWDGRRPRFAGSAVKPAEPVWILALCCIVGVAAAASLHRPDRDDAYYLGLAAAVADHPDEPLLERNPIHPEKPIRPSDRIRTFEVLLGAIARASGLTVVAVDHYLVPLIGGVLLVVAQGRLLRRLAPERWLPCLAVLTILLVTVGGEHHWHANFAFVRIWQGKSLLLSCLLPLAAVYGLDFGRRPTRRGFVRLSAVHIAGMGLSPPGLWLVPIVAGVAVASTAGSWRSLALAPLASLYSIGWGLWLRDEMGSVLRVAAGTGDGEGLAARAAPMVVGGGHLRTAILVALATAWWTCRPLAARRYCLLAPLAAAILFHPVTADLLTRHVAHASVSWRLIWVLPLPAFLALVLTVPYSWLGRGLSGRTRFALTAALVLAFLGWVPDRWLASPANQTQVRPFKLKAPAEDYDAARLLVRHTGAEASVLAPEEVAVWVMTFHHPPRPLMVRKPYLRVGSRKERSQRVWLSQFAGAGVSDPRQIGRFLTAIRDRRPGGLCVRAGSAATARGLRDLEYRQVATAGPWEVWIRQLEAEQ